LAINKSKRPIVADKSDKEPKEFIAIHLLRSFYNQASQRYVSMKVQLDIVKEIITLLA
jgi:shikimate kinase